jgi:hypothetical protein
VTSVSETYAAVWLYTDNITALGSWADEMEDTPIGSEYPTIKEYV